jgi:SAM-dependent methyltransferase
MLKWRFGANNPALHCSAAERLPGEIQVRASTGCALFGPYLDLPAGGGVARVLLKEPGSGLITMDVAAETGGRILASQSFELAELGTPILELPITIAEPLSACEIRLHCETEVSANVLGVEIDLTPSASIQPLDPNRPVGWESRKTYKDKIDNGFFLKYLSGPAVLEIGFKGYIEGVVPIVPQAIGIDLGYPGYDGVRLPFADESVDAIYSSHCFEHIDDYKTVLRDWYRLLKVGGYIVITVPHQYLFERRRHMPSTSNLDHKRYYTSESLLKEIGDTFPPNTYRVRSLADNDKNFDYTFTGKEPAPPCYEIEVVLEKIRRPYWNLDDGAFAPSQPRNSRLLLSAVIPG